MNKFLEVLAKVVGTRSRRVRPAGGLEAKSRRSVRAGVLMEPPGPRRRMILTDDLDEKGKLRPDHMARRQARREEEGRLVHAVVPDGDPTDIE